MTILQLKPNHITHRRLRECREREKDRLVRKIGINLADVPLYNEQLRFLAYEESLRK
jgi:hypothetical protein